MADLASRVCRGRAADTPSTDRTSDCESDAGEGRRFPQGSAGPTGNISRPPMWPTGERFVQKNGDGVGHPGGNLCYSRAGEINWHNQDGVHVFMGKDRHPEIPPYEKIGGARANPIKPVCTIPACPRIVT